MRWTALAVLVLIWCYPFAWLVSASLKSQQEIFAKGLNLIPDAFLWENYARAWSTAGFSHYMLNTVIVSVGTVLLVVLHSALSGYVLGRFNFIGRSLLVAVLAANLVTVPHVLADSLDDQKPDEQDRAAERSRDGREQLRGNLTVADDQQSDERSDDERGVSVSLHNVPPSFTSGGVTRWC